MTSGISPRLTSLNIFSSISNELTKPIFVSLTMANDSFLKSWLRERMIHRNKLRNCKTTSTA